MGAGGPCMFPSRGGRWNSEGIKATREERRSWDKFEGMLSFGGVWSSWCGLRFVYFTGSMDMIFQDQEDLRVISGLAMGGCATPGEKATLQLSPCDGRQSLFSFPARSTRVDASCSSPRSRVTASSMAWQTLANRSLRPLTPPAPSRDWRNNSVTMALRVLDSEVVTQGRIGDTGRCSCCCASLHGNTCIPRGAP